MMVLFVYGINELSSPFINTLIKNMSSSVFMYASVLFKYAIITVTKYSLI